MAGPMRVTMGRTEWGLVDLLISCLSGCLDQKKSKMLLQELIGEIVGNYSILFTDLGRQALYIALKSLPLAPYSEVIVPAYACQNVILPVLSAGLTPVFADISGDLNISLDHVQTLLNQKTKVVIVPHLYGRTAQIEAFDDFSKRNGIILIDDAAQSFGGIENGKWLGSYGQFGIFSFGPYKSITGTRGGALLVNDKFESSCLKPDVTMGSNNNHSPFMIAVKIWIKYGMRKYSYQFLTKRAGKPMGKANNTPPQLSFEETLPSVMSELNATLLTRVVGKTKRVIQRRKENAKRMSSALKGMEKYFDIPSDYHRNIFVKYVISLKKEYQHERPDFIAFLRNRKIECHEGYVPLHLQKSFSSYAKGELFMTEQIWRGVVCLPCDAAMSLSDVDYIANAINDYRWE